MEEVEIKFKIKDPTAIKRKITVLKPTYKGKLHQKDLWFDNPDKNWRKRGAALRIRQQDKRLFLAIKDKQRVDGRVRRAEEVEVEIGGDFEKVKKFWEQTSLVVDHLIEKEREVWDYRGLEITLDKVKNLGTFLELEGTEGAIEDAVVKLGLEKEPRIVETYGQIVEKHAKN